jgi:hypothetical protein
MDVWVTKLLSVKIVVDIMTMTANTKLMNSVHNLFINQYTNTMGKVKELMYGDRIENIGQLKHILKDLDDHDQLCIETCDEHGDVEDLYPMSIDVIDGIRLQDDTIVREVRFCQRPNSAPDTRDKQPLVDACIEQIRNDVEESDVTALDELLKKLPWEILKHFLPEDQWENFK